FTKRGADIQLLRATDLALRVILKFTPVRDPTGQPANREQHGEHARREAHSLVNDAGIEVDVRVKAALDEVLVVESDIFKLLSELKHRIAHTQLGKNRICGFLDEFRARVVA